MIFFTAHEAGLVTLQVACEGFVISNSVIFEYKKPPVDENKVKEVNRIIFKNNFNEFRFKILKIYYDEEVLFIWQNINLAMNLILLFIPLSYRLYPEK